MGQSGNTGDEPLIEAITSFGDDRGAGNLLGVQVYMRPADFAEPGRYYRQLDGYLRVARQQSWLHDNTIVIFPEYIGTWLAALGEGERVLAGDSLDQAARRLATAHPLRFPAAVLRARGRDRLTDALFRMKAGPMARVYQETFAGLARAYCVTVVAGSILLPNPAVRDGVLRPGAGPLQNVSLIFRPDGAPHERITRKLYPISREAPFVAAGAPGDLPVFATPAGRLAVLICADSWYPAAYRAIRAQQPDIVAVPNHETPGGTWHQPWGGYDPGPLPPDVDPADVGRLTNRQAWLKYALAGRLAESGARAGMHVFFRGRMWDLTGSGHTIVAAGDAVYEAPHVAGAALCNYWLPGAP